MPHSGIDRVPPNNLEAERAVLGACLLDNDALMVVTETLQPDDFYEPRHGLALEIMSDMAGKGRAVDSLTFQEELTKRSQLDRLGGIPFIATLVDAVTTTSNIEHHCNIVRDKSIHRGLIRVGSEIAKIGLSEEIESSEALATAEQEVYEIAKHGTTSLFKHVAQVVVETFDNFENSIAEDAAGRGIPTGFADLDKLTGGLQPGSLNIIAARPSMGKTAFALNIAQYAALHKEVPVLIFSLEMSAEQLASRLLSAEAEINLKELQQTKNVRPDQWNSLTNAVARLSKSPIYIDDSSMLTTLELRSRCRRFFAKQHDKHCLIIVDYLQLMANARKSENRQQEVSDISRALKGVAREFEAPVIALSQLSREVEKRGSDKRPMLSDLRDSGAIEQDADLVAFLYRPAYYEQDKVSADPSAEVAVAKHRNGPTGKVDLIFYKEFSRFVSREYTRRVA